MSRSFTQRSQLGWWPLWIAVSLPMFDISVQAISVNFAFVLLWVAGGSMLAER